ncbi:hypothetical protein [uncultured Tenacibaculum sp.]|uniref:hypothetical protein n=1 Tax=uncultured Tenacibaculum sp. TaxID=174713 RepID=UPI002618C5B1|nr:hypothetical protein [uncultured Tenacibaculum sp.]
MNKSSLIDKYFQNMLSTKEETIFNELLITDNEFAREFKFQKDVKVSLEILERRSLKKYLQEIENTHFYKEKTNFFYLKLIASITLLFAIVNSSELFNFNKTDHKRLYASYFTTFDNVIYVMNRGEDEDNLKKEAFLAYENKEFNVAVFMLSNAYEETQESDLLLYLGISLLASDQYEKGQSILLKYLQLNSKYKVQAQWYIALSYLALNKTVESKKYLQQIAIGSHKFKKQEVELLLKKMK